ncbi:MAG: hypothetical protein ACKODA_06760 [Nevskiaceae bacterium]
MLNFFRQRVIDPLLGLLKQGLSPRELALLEQAEKRIDHTLTEEVEHRLPDLRRYAG